MRIVKLASILTIALLLGCGNRALKPVAFSEGDMCSFCKMAISEKRYASELVDADGEVYKFDDIGCMRNYMQKQKIKPSTVFVVDFDSRQWLDGKKASYVRSQQFQTPMGGQTAAFANEEEAKRAAKKYQGALVQLW